MDATKLWLMSKWNSSTHFNIHIRHQDATRWLTWVTGYKFQKRMWIPSKCATGSCYLFLSHACVMAHFDLSMTSVPDDWSFLRRCTFLLPHCGHSKTSRCIFPENLCTCGGHTQTVQTFCWTLVPVLHEKYTHSLTIFFFNYDTTKIYFSSQGSNMTRNSLTVHTFCSTCTKEALIRYLNFCVFWVIESR